MMLTTILPIVVYVYNAYYVYKLNQFNIVTMSKKSHINLIYPCWSAFFHLIETDPIFQAHF